MRDSFKSRIGFVLAAAGSAVGLGNIWGFPTQVANHGGGALLLGYLCGIFVLAIPALYSEMLIGHHAQANPVRSLKQLSEGRMRPVGGTMGLLGVIGSCVRFLSHRCRLDVSSRTRLSCPAMGLSGVAEFLLTGNMVRNLVLLRCFGSHPSYLKVSTKVSNSGQNA